MNLVMAVKLHLGWLVLLVACAAITTPDDEVLVDDLDEREDTRTPRTDRLERFIDEEASARVDYDLVYDVFVDGRRQGTGRMWRTPPDDARSDSPIVTGYSLRGTNLAGDEVSLSRVSEYASTPPYALLQLHARGDDTMSIVAAGDGYVVRDDDGQRTIPRTASMNLLELEIPVLRSEELRKGMWMKSTYIDPETAARVSITSVITRLGWAEYQGSRVRVLWLETRTSDGDDSEAVVLSNGILASGTPLPGVEVRLRGVVFTR